jgi:hypothetical protein
MALAAKTPQATKVDPAERERLSDAVDLVVFAIWRNVDKGHSINARIGALFGSLPSETLCRG